MTDSKAHETEQVDNNAPSSSPVHQAQELAFPVIGLVGSAGSRQALETFFRNMPNDTGMAFIVVTRLAGRHLNALPAEISARTDMPVLTAADGATLQPDHIYLAPHGVHLTLTGGMLRLQNPDHTAATSLLDTFLFSLAADQGKNAVAVVLSGTGKDTVAALQSIKAQAGLILVQDPEQAAHPALPRRAIATRVADLVAAIPEIALHLVHARGDLAEVQAPTHAEQDQTLAEVYTAILTQVGVHTGRDLSHYKSSTLQRRIARRMQMHGFHNLAQYLEMLRANPEETIALFKDCLVSVTSFFRDPDAYMTLERDCLPQIFEGKGRNDLVRVWVAGCATGEEAYSVAMQLTERAALMEDPPRIQVFATDLNEDAIAFARRGVYSVALVKDIGRDRLQRFLSKENGSYQIKPEIREMVLFAVHDLLKDPPFSRLDLICCRNVLIYFNREAQEKVFDIFHYALNPKGYLFLGSSESTDSAAELFTVVNKDCHLYQRRVQASQLRRLAATALAVSSGRIPERATPRQEAKPRTVEEMYLLWTLRHYTPPRLLINENYDITHLFGGADRYLQEREGAITQHILQKVLPDLRLDLRAALYQAFNKGERTVSRLLGVEIGGEQHLIQLHVGPVGEAGFPKEYAEVVFIEREGTTLTELSTDGLAEADLSLVERMEEELLRTRERLQTIIKEHEIANQELKASNEELQSINEELKSTTEELETSKEELQSMNEELITVNGELKQKIDELYRVNSDLLNLIASTDVGVVFLNDELQIKRFTPRALELFNLIEGDIGRPFPHVTNRIRHPALTQLVAHVRDTGERIEETVQSDNNHWYILRVFPYRTVTGETDGLVITFIDISDLKRAEAEERQRKQQQTLAALGRAALETSDLTQLMTSATQQVAEVLDMQFCKVLELQPGGNTLLLKAGVGWHLGIVGQSTVLTDTETQAGYTLQAKAPVVVRDLRTESRFRAPALLIEHHVLSGISVVIPGIQEPYGVLGVHDREPRSFAPYDVDFLQSVANTLAAAIVRRRAEVALHAQERRYRLIFESVGVSIWEEDFTEVKARLRELQTPEIPDLRAHLTAHPELVMQIAALVRIRDVNRQTLTLFGAKSKGELLTTLDQIFVPETMPTFIEELITLAEGRSYYEAETVLQTLQGERRHVFLTVTFPDADVEPDRVLVSILDINERKQAETVLQRYADMLQASYDAVMVWSLDHGLEFWNHGAETLYGYTTQEAVGQISHRLLATEHSQPLPDILATLERSGVWEGELKHTTKTGDTVIVSTRHQLVEGADGNAVILEINRDITAQKQAEDEQRESEMRFQVMADTAPVLIWVSGLDKDCTFFNEPWLTFTGRTMAQEIGAGWTEGIHPDDYAHTVAIYNTSFDARQAFEMEYRLRRYDGAYRWLLDRGTPRFAPDGSFAGYIGSCLDIDDRKQIEEDLRQNEAHFRQMADAVPQIVWISDSNGQQSYLNQRWFDYTGIPVAESPINTDESIHPEDRDDATQIWHAAQARGEPYEYELRLRGADGIYRWHLSRSVPVHDAKGSIVRWFGTSTDIDARKRAELDKQFLNDLEIQHRLLSVPDTIVGTTVAALCDHLHLTFCAYDEIDSDPEQIGVNPLWQSSTVDVPFATGNQTYSLATRLSPAMQAEAQTGRVIVVHDADRDARTAATAPNSMRGLLIVPVFRETRWCALLTATNREPRQWSDREIALVETVAARLWSNLERVRAEQAVQASEAQLRLVTDNVSGLISYVDHDQRYRFVNAVYEQWFAQPREQLIGRTVREALGDAAYMLAQQHMAHVFGGEQVSFENTISYADGVTRTVLTTYVPDVETNGQIGGFYALVTDISERKQAEERLQFLAEASNILASSLDYTVTLQNVAHTAVSGIADWCAIDLLQDDGSIKAAVIAHVDPAKIQWAEALRQHYPVTPDDPTGVPAVIRTGQSEFYPEITDAMFQAAAKNAEELQFLRTIGYRALMIVPLQTHGQILGAITLVSTQDGRFFDRDDLAMAEEVARRAAASIANAQLHRAVQQREQQLSISEERLRLATEAGGIGIYDYNLLNHNATFSNIYRQIGGFTPDEKLTRPMWLARIHPDDRDMVDESLQRAVDHGESYDYEYRIYRADGALRWLEIHSQVTVDETGRAVRLTGALSDITTRKQAEEEIRRLNRDLKRRLDELQTLLDVAPIGIFVAHDPECQVITSNPAGAKMLGIDLTENASKNRPADELPFRVMRNSQEVPTQELPMQYAARHDVAVYNVELDIVYADGRVANFYEYALPLHDEEGQVRGCLGIFIDITERKQVEEALRDLTASLEQRVTERTAELERSNRELDQFAYVASHDLKAPLRAIVNLAGWIAEDAGERLPKPSLEHLEKLRGRALRMERLLDDLLTYSRIGRRDGVVEGVKIDALVQDMIYFLAPSTGFQVVMTSEMPVLLTQRTPLELVFRNLIGNAIKHHHQPALGVVQISAQDLGDFVEFVISDNGPGIDPQYHERIFGMFQTLRPRDQLEGSGMGLAIVKRAVEYRDGTISVESVEGTGTTFRFTWPKQTEFAHPSPER